MSPIKVDDGHEIVYASEFVSIVKYANQAIRLQTL